MHIGGGHLALHGGDGIAIGSTVSDITPPSWGANAQRVPGTYTGVTVSGYVPGTHPTFTVVVAASDGSITSVTAETTGSAIYDYTGQNTLTDAQLGNGGALDILFNYTPGTGTQAKLTMIGDTTLAVTTAGATINSKDVILDGAVTSHLIPDTDIAYDLGSATHKFRDLYLDGSSIHLGSTILRDDGSGNLQVNLTNVLQIAADDSTIRTINSGESIKFIGAGGVTTATNAEGDLTITGAASLDNLTDVKFGGADFTDSIKIGDTTTGILNAANNNVIIGVGAYNTMTSSDDNVVIGYNAGASGGQNLGENVIIGKNAHSSSQAVSSVIIGKDTALFGGATDVVYQSVIIGRGAGNGNAVTGSIAIGYLAGNGPTDNSNQNISIGTKTLRYVKGTGSATSTNNIAIGEQAMEGVPNVSESDQNIAIGTEALTGVTTGSTNVTIGHQAGMSITDGSNNVILGNYAGTSSLADTVAIYTGGGTERLTIDSTGLINAKTSSLTLESTDSGSLRGPLITLQRNSTSPAPFDYLGAMIFKGKNSLLADTQYGTLNGRIVDPTSGSETGRIEMLLLDSNVNSLTYIFTPSKFQLYNQQSIEWSQFNTSLFYDVTLVPEVPTADRTITLPNETGTLATQNYVDTRTTFNGDVTGSVFGDDSTLIVDGVNNTVTLGGGTVNEFSTDGTLAGNSDSAVPTEKAIKTYVDLGTNPTGSIIAFAGINAPTGWLLCYGQAVLRTTYADLFAVFDTIYGVGDGSTTFNIPDLRGRTIAGQDDMGSVSADRLTGAGGIGGIDGDVLGSSGGAETVTLTESQIPAHEHSYNYSPDTGDTNNTTGIDVSGGSSAATTGTTGGGAAHVNIQPTLILNYIIKT
jgi:microcystin-dependent protein